MAEAQFLVPFLTELLGKPKEAQYSDLTVLRALDVLRALCVCCQPRIIAWAGHIEAVVGRMASLAEESRDGFSEVSGQIACLLSLVRGCGPAKVQHGYVV